MSRYEQMSRGADEQMSVSIQGTGPLRRSTKADWQHHPWLAQRPPSGSHARTGRAARPPEKRAFSIRRRQAARVPNNKAVSHVRGSDYR